MRTDAIELEDGRLEGKNLENYPWYNERHRIFPKVFFHHQYEKILDIAAGVGIIGKKIDDETNSFMLCNDISPESLSNLKRNQLKTISFDLDNKSFFPFKDNSFDAVISLATVEHIIHIDSHVNEIKRILAPGGHLYISAPNYSGLQFYVPYLLNGKSFHDPLKEGLPKYEFYAHVRYFTYKTLLEFIASFGLVPKYVFLSLPEKSSRYLSLKNRSKLLAYIFRSTIKALYAVATPRWAFHPVLCFEKPGDAMGNGYHKPKKILV